MRTRLTGVVVALALLTAPPPAADARAPKRVPAGGPPVTVKKNPAKIKTKRIDPAAAEQPPSRRGDEAGVVQYNFKVSISPGVRDPVEQPGGDNNGRVKVSTRLDSVTLLLDLDVTVWLSPDADEKAKAHVRGHRQIVEQVYKTADRVALKVANRFVGRSTTGTGASRDKALKQAAFALVEKLNAEYVRQTDARCTRVEQIYDELTRGGTTPEPSAADAVKQAFEQEAKETGRAKKAAKPKVKPKAKAKPKAKQKRTKPPKKKPAGPAETSSG